MVRVADASDVPAVARLLHEFNREFGEPSPPPDALAERLRQLLRLGDSGVLVGGGGPDGIAVLRFRPALWTDGLECHLAELYVVPPRRGRGLGRALLVASMDLARGRGADTMDIGVDEPDSAARALYESAGFSNRSGAADGGVMYLYERDL